MRLKRNKKCLKNILLDSFTIILVFRMRIFDTFRLAISVLNKQIFKLNFMGSILFGSCNLSTVLHDGVVSEGCRS